MKDNLYPVQVFMGNTIFSSVFSISKGHHPTNQMFWTLQAWHQASRAQENI